MSGEENSHILLFAQGFHRVPEQLPCLRIKPGCGLIKNEDLRLVQKRARNVNSPALTARKLSHGATQKIFKVKHFCKLGLSFFEFGALYSIECGTASEVIRNGKRLIQHGILKHYADISLDIVN